MSYLSKEFDSGGICYDAVFGLCEGVSEQRICQSVRKKDKEIYTQRRKCKIAVCHGKAIFRYEVVGWKSIGSGGSNWNRKNDYIMKIDVTEYEKKYTFELAPITQLCGQNIPRKTYILESIRRYFSTYKYSEEQNKWRNNVKIDNELVGRKFFTVLSVNEAAELLTWIKWSKQSLMVEYVKGLMQKFDWQLHLRTIDEELEEMFQLINKDLSHLGDVELTYAVSDVWDMVQKSNVVGNGQTSLEDKNNFELFTIFLNLIGHVMEINPRKLLIIVENIDHLISKKEYEVVLKQMQQICIKYDVYFILSTSLDGYVGCDGKLCSGITVLGEVDFQMPEFNEIETYIENNYPCNRRFSEEQLQENLKKIIQHIGQKEYLYTVEDNVICKLINQTLMLNDRWEDTEKKPEIAFLKA